MSEYIKRDKAMSRYINQDKVIDAVLEMDTTHRVSWQDAVIDMIDAMPSEDVRPVRWIPCSVINHCFIPELQDFPYGGLLFTYVTQKGKHLVGETWIERGRIVGKKMNGTPIAYMPLPEPYQKGADDERVK